MVLWYYGGQVYKQLLVVTASRASTSGSDASHNNYQGRPTGPGHYRTSTHGAAFITDLDRDRLETRYENCILSIYVFVLRAR